MQEHYIYKDYILHEFIHVYEKLNTLYTSCFPEKTGNICPSGTVAGESKGKHEVPARRSEVVPAFTTYIMIL